MNTHRAVSVLLAAVAATMLVTGSFGFTSVSAERGVSVNVVDSENAYVGVSSCEKSNGNGNGANKVKLNVSNRFSDDFTVQEITVGKSGESTWVKGPLGDPIYPGQSAMFRIKAYDYNELTVKVTDGLDASVTVEVSEQKCDPGGGPNVNQAGRQNADGTGTPTAEPTEQPTETPTPEAA